MSNVHLVAKRIGQFMEGHTQDPLQIKFSLISRGSEKTSQTLRLVARKIWDTLRDIMDMPLPISLMYFENVQECLRNGPTTSRTVSIGSCIVVSAAGYFFYIYTQSDVQKILTGP